MMGPDQRTSPLYDPSFEHDACGIGAVVDLKGRRTYETVDNARKSWSTAPVRTPPARPATAWA